MSYPRSIAAVLISSLTLATGSSSVFAASPETAAVRAVDEVMSAETAVAKQAGVTMKLLPTSDDGLSGDTGWNSGRYNEDPVATPATAK